MAWSPSASTIAYATQDCELNFASVAESASGKAKVKPSKLMLRTNPLLSGIFTSETKFIGCGFDKVPFLYENSGDWKQSKSLDEGIASARQAKITNNKFKDMRVYFNPDIKLSTTIEMKETDTRHANYINCLKVFGAGQKVQILSTSDVNGYLNWWDVNNL